MDSTLKDKLNAVRQLYRLGAMTVNVGDIAVVFSKPYEQVRKPKRIKVTDDNGDVFYVEPPEQTPEEQELAILDKLVDDTAT